MRGVRGIPRELPRPTRSCGFVDEPSGAARALRAVWTVRGQRGALTTACPHSRASRPQMPQDQQQQLPFCIGKRGKPDRSVCPWRQPECNFQNRQVSGNILDEATKRLKVTFQSEAIRTAILIVAQQTGVARKKKSPGKARRIIAGVIAEPDADSWESLGSVGQRIQGGIPTSTRAVTAART